MRILIVGALSWNPERIRSLHEHGHELWGCWSRSMGWDQGPYPMLDDCVRTIAIGEAARTIADEQIDCVYALFQVYGRPLWGSTAPGIEHDVWTLLRVLFAERAKGAFDAPIVFHWGFDVHLIDGGIARALDGQIFCNREQLTYWSTPVAAGGAGLDFFETCEVTGFLDSDRPKAEFMNDNFSERLSERTGQIHTVCIGRPFNIDYGALARNGIHLHVYGNDVVDSASMIAREIIAANAARDVSRIRDFIHLHPSLQPTGKSWTEVRECKSRWVREFSRYDAGWSYIGAPYPWAPLEDRSAIPNRLSTYLLAGLPAITDHRPGFYRYDELARLGVNIDLEGSDHERLRARLDAEAAHPERHAIAVSERHGYSFDASIGPLLAVLEQAQERYFAKPTLERRRPIIGREAALTGATRVSAAPEVSRRRGTLAAGTRRRVSRARVALSRPVALARRQRVVRRLKGGKASPEHGEHRP
jgi:hypothetical protein